MQGQYWRSWKANMELKGKGELVKLLIKECNSFCSVMVLSVKHRLAPYWDTIQCLELIDPSGPQLDQYTTEEVWAAAEKLGDRRGIDCTTLRDEVILVRSEFPDYDPTLKGDHPHIHTHKPRTTHHPLTHSHTHHPLTHSPTHRYHPYGSPELLP